MTGCSQRRYGENTLEPLVGIGRQIMKIKKNPLENNDEDSREMSSAVNKEGLTVPTNVAG